MIALHACCEGCCGFYTGIRGGTAILDDRVPGYDFDFDPCITVALLAGYAPASNWRIETQVGYLYSNMNDIKVDGDPTAVGGKAEIISTTINLITLLPFNNKTALSTGLGIGAKYEHLNLCGKNLPPIDFYETDFLYEIMVGVNRLFNRCWEVSLEYHLANPDADLKSHSFTVNARRFF